MKNVALLVSPLANCGARMCFITYQGQVCACLCNEDHRMGTDFDGRRGGGGTSNETATYNITAEMTRVISFLLILAIILCA